MANRLCGVVSFTYRLMVLLAISLLVSSRYLFFGSFVAAWSLYMTMVNPLRKAIQAPLRDGRLRPMAKRIYSVGRSPGRVPAVPVPAPLPAIRN